MKIVIDADIPYIRGILEPFAETLYLKGAEISRSDLVGADALIVRTRTKCGSELLAGSSVRLIASATIGSDHIDVEYCRAHGIEVATAAGSNARGVLQWLGGALVALQRREGWTPQQRVVGVVGVGNVGSLVARYALEWGFEVICCDPPRQRAGEVDSNGEAFIELDELVGRADIITLHTPLIRSGVDMSYHMVDGAFFQKLRRGSTLINSSRGEVVDGVALRRAIMEGRCGAVIDTWEGEPDIDRSLLELSTLSTPHIAGYSAQGKANATSMVVSALAERFGLPLQGWYPSGVERLSDKIAGTPISWSGLQSTILDYFDIEGETKALKRSPDSFEHLRNNYPYRTEYF